MYGMVLSDFFYPIEVMIVIATSLLRSSPAHWKKQSRSWGVKQEDPNSAMW
jgi:hypothetical protein